jgi:DNA-binding NarL/FixJ family response regulator
MEDKIKYEPLKGRPLSKREKEVLNLLAEGRTNAEIADALYITQQTVKNHIWFIYTKLGVTNRVQAALYWKNHKDEIWQKS